MERPHFVEQPLACVVVAGFYPHTAGQRSGPYIDDGAAEESLGIPQSGNSRHLVSIQKSHRLRPPGPEPGPWAGALQTVLLPWRKKMIPPKKCKLGNAVFQSIEVDDRGETRNVTARVRDDAVARFLEATRGDS